MKRLIFIGFLFLTILFNGCLKDEGNYSLSDVWLGFGVVKQSAVNSSDFWIVTDKGNILDPVVFDSYYRSFYYGSEDFYAKWKNGDRVLLNYTILDEKTDSKGKVEKYFIKVNSVKKILMKKIIDITPAINDSIGNDPIYVLDSWVTDSLLNLKFRYYGKYKTHYINLIKNPGVLTAASQPIQLEFRHNDNGDADAYPFVSFVSFRLPSLKIQGLDSVKFVVKSKDYNGKDFEYKGTYRY